MPETHVMPSAEELFQKWKDFLFEGVLTTANHIAANQPELISSVQQLINGYIADHATALQETLSRMVRTSQPNGPLPILPDLKILERLGHGGMGEVYRVLDALDREFALKLALPGRLSETDVSRFLDEARAMANLDHPNLAKIHHFGVHNGRPYFLMKIYPSSLKDRLAEFQADAKKAVHLMAQVAQGVAHLHAKGMIHRDLKPHNILLTDEGHPAVSDFGLVKNLSDTSQTASLPLADPNSNGESNPKVTKHSRTITGTVMGTRVYMAPEQAAGLTHLANPKWDVWALGVMLHQLFTGQYPYSSEAPERLLDPNEPDNPPPSTIKPNLDSKVERIICKCLARNESDRYANAGEVSRAINNLIRRKQRRWMRLGAMVATCIVAFFVWWVSVNGEPERSFRRDREILETNKAVQLEPAVRIRLQAYKILGNTEIVPQFDKEGNGIKIATTEPVLMVLLDDPGITNYQFEAEISQFQKNPNSEVGIFTNLQTIESIEGRRLNYVASTINLDEPVNDREGKFELNIWSLLPREATGPRDYPTFSSVSLEVGRFSIPKGASGPWIKVVAKVRPNQTTWLLPNGEEYTLANPLPIDRHDELTTISRPILGQPVELPIRGELGVYVFNSSCTFRNIVIRPLTE